MTAALVGVAMVALVGWLAVAAIRADRRTPGARPDGAMGAAGIG